jgi:uncharacterized protein (UPF0333 family)
MRIFLDRQPKVPTSERGQASAEYALVLVGMLALIIACGTLHAFLADGAIIEHALANSSHAIESFEVDNIKDFVSV